MIAVVHKRMREYRALLIVSGILSCITLQAQENDSARQVYTEQFQQRYHFFAKDIVTQPFISVNNYLRLEGGYSRKGGGYRQAQDARAQNDIIFFTEGTKKINRYQVSGSFAYTHILQDSVGYTLKYGLDDAQPYYLYAYKRGSWQVGKYNLQGSVSRPFLHDKLFAGVDVKYNSINAWRNSDPRPEQFTYHMNIEGALGWKLVPGHSISASGIIVRKSNELSIDYRNKDYQMSLAYPEYVTRIQYGYGFEDRSAGSPLESNTTGYGWKAAYTGAFDFGNVTVKGGYISLDTKIEGVKTVFLPDGYYGSFYEDIWDASLYWEYQKRSNRFSLLANYINHLGRDLNQFLKANNYVYSLEQLSVQPVYAHLKKNRTKYELAIDAKLRDLFRADGNTGTLADYQQAEVGVSGAWYAYFSNQSMLKAKLGGSIKHAIDPLFSVPAQESVFINSVVYYDYYYFSADTWRMDADLLYSLPVRKTNAFIRLQGGYEKATIAESSVPAPTLPGTKRWYWQASVGVSL